MAGERPADLPHNPRPQAPRNSPSPLTGARRRRCLTGKRAVLDRGSKTFRSFSDIFGLSDLALSLEMLTISGDVKSGGTVQRFAGFALDQLRSELRGPDGQAIKLRPKTFAMLTLFAANAGRVLSKQELMEAIWPGLHVGDDSLFQCVREIRSALADDKRQLIKVISGRGYLFDAEVTDGPTANGSTAPLPGANDQPGPVAEIAPRAIIEPAKQRYFPTSVRGRATALAMLVVFVAVTVAASVLAPGLLFARKPPVIAVMPIVGTSGDPQTAAMAAGVTDSLADGLAKIENIRVSSPVKASSTSGAAADFSLTGELQKNEHGWTLRARLTKAATGEIAWSSTTAVSDQDIDAEMQQSRLTASLGHPLAVYINTLINDYLVTSSDGVSGNAKVTVQQATASINHTTRERFKVSQDLLEKALANDPNDVDLQAALAAMQLRGIQMVWYNPQERAAAKKQGTALLERALRTKPSYLPVLEGYCRFLSATNQFAESLVACARALSFDPWDGIALYLIGLNQIFLGRFEDGLATFKQADRFDTPVVSRWTWLLGAGICELNLGHNEAAISWLKRSLAITAATGRTHLVLAAAYQRAGRLDEAKAAIAMALKLRPGTTAANFAPPPENTSHVYLEATQRVRQTLIEAGLPAR